MESDKAAEAFQLMGSTGRVSITFLMSSMKIGCQEAKSYVLNFKEVK